MTTERYRALSVFYASQISKANEDISGIRAKAQREYIRIDSELRALGAEYRRENSKGEGDAGLSERARASQADLLRRINDMGNELVKLKTLLDAQSSADVAGIEEPSHGRGGATASGRRASIALPDLILMVLAACLVVASVFVPWLRVQDVSGGLFTLDKPLMAAADATGSASVVLRWMWVGVLLVPLAGIAVAAARRSADWASICSLLAIGVAMLTTVLFPVVLIGLRPGMVGSALHLTTMLRPGAWLYAGAALALVALGSRKLDVVLGIRGRGRPTVLLVSVLMGALFVVLLVLLLACMSPGVAVTLEASLSSPWQEAIEVRCTNLGSDPIVLQFVPQVRETTESSEISALSYFTLSVFAQQRAGETFRLYPGSLEEWRVKSGVLVQDGLIRLNPGLTARVDFFTRPLRTALDEVHALRITLQNARGRELGRYETVLPPPLPEEPGPVSEALGVSRQVVESPPSEMYVPAPALLVLDAGSVEDTFTVRLKGVLGDRAVLQIVDASEVRSCTLRAGEEAAMGWRVDAVSASPASARLRHDVTGRTATVRRGEEVALASPRP